MDTPAPTGLLPPAPDLPRLTFEFQSKQIQPAHDDLFLYLGGPIAAAAARDVTDFALSGSAQSTTATLSDKRPTKVRLLVPPGMVSRNSSDDMTLDIDNRSKLIVTSEHIGASINGTLVCTVAGKAAVYLSDILRQNHASVPLVYSGWLAHAAVVETFKMRIVDDAENTYGVNFVAHPERDAALQHAEELSGKWASGAWNMRQNSLVYPPAMSLTKTIAKVASGINDSGYDLVHNVMELSLPYSYETINSMIENAVKVDLEFVTSDIDQFLLDTNVPGLKAARWGRTLAASLTIAINFLVAYRADGRTRITPSGVAFATAESWEDRGPGRCTGSEDCDGTAMLAASLARTIVQAPPEILAAHAHINAFKNILCPHFTIGVSVLGASGAEASGGGDASSTGQSVAGHAAALMVPALSMLNALAKGSRAIVGGSPVVPEDVRAEVAEARFNACFSPEVRASLCENERDALRNWEVASQLDTGLTSLAIEGTTPSEGHLHRTGNAKANAEKNAALDSAVFAKVGPNVGRSMKILDVGGSNPQSPHKFYHDFVEFNLGRSHPLWTDAGVRAKGYAMSQFVLCKEPDRDSGALSVAGATPRDIAVNQYSAVPHVVVNADTAALLDYASDAAGLQVMARSKPTTQLDAYQSDQLTKSLKSLSALENSLQNQPNVEGTNRSPQTHTYTCTRTRMLP